MVILLWSSYYGILWLSYYAYLIMVLYLVVIMHGYLNYVTECLAYEYGIPWISYEFQTEQL